MAIPPLTIIVQAGGRGSRLRHHTWNKPKCLVSVRGKPMLYHLFERFPEARFIIIGDYLFNQLETYLKVNPPGINYTLIQASEKGTAAGIAQAKAEVASEAPLMLAWSDLILGELPELPDVDVPVIATTSAFTCRWTVAPEGHLHEQPGTRQGIPGLFYFPRAELLPEPPIEGEFVRWFASNVHNYTLLDCPDMEELGDFSTIEQSNDRAGFCRFFNKVEMQEDRVIKTVVDSDYEALHAKEVAWYQQARQLGFRRIPHLYSEEPLIMERIHGQQAYDMHDLNEREKRAVLADYLDALISLHDLDAQPADPADVREVYLNKTLKRVLDVADIIPGFHRETVSVNGKKCRNVFSDKYHGLLEDILPSLMPPQFVPTHGDATFSNAIIDDKLRTWFIDPRGYFAKPGIMGDPWYDFAKVYYSAVGGYDIFNRRKFKLHVDEETVEVLMETPVFAKTAQDIFPEYFGKEMPRLEILHGLIWLSLSGYAKDDIDSVIGSFYLGLYWLESGLASFEASR